MPGSGAKVKQPPVSEADWFRFKVTAIFGDGALSAMARLLRECGDKREVPTILRSISNFATGRHRVPGEMRALLTLLEAPEAIPDKISVARGDKPPPAFKLLDPPAVSAAPPRRRQVAESHRMK